ncbi:hypothetical protein Y888_05965 [Mixta calida B021323]|nr:hypothetical protein Y888_05965 [Mixta calida B021323]
MPGLFQQLEIGSFKQRFIRKIWINRNEKASAFAEALSFV